MARSPSPLRYAGGKSWLAADMVGWCRAAGARTLVEPFAGGASVAITAVLSGAVERAVLAEADPSIRALWECVLLGGLGEYGAFLTRLMRVCPTRDGVRAFLAETDGGRAGAAARALVGNRAAFGGIQVAGMLSDEQLRLRWRPHEWVARMKALRRRRDAFFVHGPCAMACIAAHADDPGAFFFVDPPYSVAARSAGHGLYRHAVLDHDALLAALARVRGSVVVTYDRQPETLALAERHGFYFEPLPMHDGRGRPRTELLLAKSANSLCQQ